jgi:hypothetical protein
MVLRSKPVENGTELILSDCEDGKIDFALEIVWSHPHGTRLG